MTPHSSNPKTAILHRVAAEVEVFTKTMVIQRIQIYPLHLMEVVEGTRHLVIHGLMVRVELLSLVVPLVVVALILVIQMERLHLRQVVRRRVVEIVVPALNQVVEALEASVAAVLGVN